MHATEQCMHARPSCATTCVCHRLRSSNCIHRLRGEIRGPAIVPSRLPTNSFPQRLRENDRQ